MVNLVSRGRERQVKGRSKKQQEMGPVIKTYGGYKPKRRGLPKFMKETLETTGNAFSALHIDNLKAIRGADNLKQKNRKVTKPTMGREVQPTFDDTLDSTFDKILKSDKNKLSDKKASLPDSPKKISGMDSAIPCWTCGCIPTSNMAHHVLFECKEDSYYSSPSPRAKKAVARRVKQGVKAKRRKRLELLKSSPKKSLDGESPAYERNPPVLGMDIAAPKFLVNDHTFISPVKSPFKTPLCKGSRLIEKSSVFITSTPDVCDKRPEFSIQTSPILVQLLRDNIEGKDLPVPLVGNAKINSLNFVDDMSKVLTKSHEVSIEQFLDKIELVSREPEDFVNVLDEQKLGKEIGRVHPLFLDSVQNEQEHRQSRITLNSSVDLIETSFVEPLCHPNGYITKRRMWRRTRRTAFNLSVDMFRSISKSTFDDKSVADASSVTDNLKAITSDKSAVADASLVTDNLKAITSDKSAVADASSVTDNLKAITLDKSVADASSVTDYLKAIASDKSAVADASSVADKLKAMTSRNDESFWYGREQVSTWQQFSILLDVKGDVGVKSDKSLNYVKTSSALESNMECAGNSSVMEFSGRVDSVTAKHSDLDLRIHELSRELKVCLTFLSPEDIMKDLAYVKYDSDVDMFSEWSIQHSKSLLSSKSNVADSFEEHMCASPALKANTYVISQLTEPLSSSLKKFTSSSIMDTSVKSLSDESVRENPIVGESIREVSLKQESLAEKSLSSIVPIASRSLNVDASLRPHSLSVAGISQDSDVSFEVVLKPCYVKLHRYDTQTIADVTYASHWDMSFSEDDSESEIFDHEKLNESNHSTSCNAGNNSFNTVVELPLPLLGKLDKITIRGSTKTSQSSFDSVLRNGRLLERSIAKLAEMQTDDEAAKQHHEINRTALDDFREVLSRCGQTEPLPFIQCYPESMLPMCKKIGEGAYGEVFLYDADKQKTVIKIIPIEGDIEINAAVQKKFWEIKPEIIVAQELSALRKLKTGRNACDIFNEVLAVRCVRGKYPQWMLDLWHVFDEEKGSENDCPDVFGNDQLFIILELAHGGQDLESYEFTSAEQAVAAITQIAFALAVGESEIEFEHRDLHWGNVLVAPTKAKTVQFTLAGVKYKVNSKGVKVSVIDFTMSRMTMPGNGGNMLYDFGHDEELFAAQGDYQCDIYRLMRERTRNNWSVYEPFTNVLWLHYLLDKMCSMVVYRNQTTKTHQQAMVKLENMRDAVLAYSSATTFSTSEFFKSSKVR